MRFGTATFTAPNGHYEQIWRVWTGVLAYCLRPAGEQARRGLMWQRCADDCARCGGGGHEVDAAGAGVQGWPEPDDAAAPAAAGVPAALLAEVVVAEVVGCPPGDVLPVGQVAEGQPGTCLRNEFDADAEVLIAGFQVDDGCGH